MPAKQDHNEIAFIAPSVGKDVLLLQGFTITEELGRLFTINVELVSTQYIKFEDILGENVSIRLDLPVGKRFFNGHVSSISQGINEGSYARYSATIHPWLWFLTRTSDCRIFQNKTVPEIIKGVCSELGFTDIQDGLTGNYPPREYIVQYRETDFNFLSRLMELEGFYYYFTHKLGNHTMVLADDYASHELNLGEIPYYPPNESAVRDEEYIFDWFLRKRIQPGTCALNDYNPLTPQADLHVDTTITRTHSEAHHEVYDEPGEYDKHSDGEEYSKKRIQEFHAQYEEGRGQGIARELACGCLFSLKNFPRDDQNREYIVVLVTHSIQISDFESERSAASAAAYINDFTVIESKTPYRSPRITPKPVIQGPQTAFVVGPEGGGEEIHTDEYGRVKVQFHWDRLGVRDENSSCWIRVAEHMAGKKWGSIYIPRVGQEVIVEFLEGDPDRPIIVGAVRNADHPPPYDLPANKTQSGTKTRSSKEGTPENFNELRFEDKKGEEEIYMHAELNLKTIVENDERREVYHDRYTTIGTEEDSRPEEDVETEVAWGSRVVNVHGNDGLVVMDGDKGRMTRIKDGDHQLVIDKGNNLVEVKQGSDSETIAGSKTINADTIELTAGTSITLTVGSSTIKLDQGGIKIKGIMVEIEATAKAEMKAPMTDVTADGKLVLKGGIVLIN